MVFDQISGYNGDVKEKGMRRLLLALLVLLSGCQAFSAVTKVGVDLGPSRPNGGSQAAYPADESLASLDSHAYPVT